MAAPGPPGRPERAKRLRGLPPPRTCPSAPGLRKRREPAIALKNTSFGPVKNRNLSDWVVALAVIACSAVLFCALAFALTGRTFSSSSRLVQVNFHDVTGIKASSIVKYAGAAAGTVSQVRMLTPGERAATGDPRNAVQITLALNENVPPLPKDIEVTVAADTLLSDKFVLLSGGSPATGTLATGATLQGISPITFDRLARNIDDAIEGLRQTFGSDGLGTDTLLNEARDILKKIQALLDDTRPLLADVRPLLAEVRPILTDAKVVAADARGLIGENRGPLKDTILKLNTASGSLDQLAKRGDTLLRNNERKITSGINNLDVSLENFKVTSTYLKILTRNLTLRPSQLIWGGKPPPLPSEQEILKARGPVPLN